MISCQIYEHICNMTLNSKFLLRDQNTADTRYLWEGQTVPPGEIFKVAMWTPVVGLLDPLPTPAPEGWVGGLSLLSSLKLSVIDGTTHRI